MILTAARMKQVIGAKSSEFDLPGAIWMIPAEQTKTGQAFRVPLSPRAVEVVERVRRLGSPICFSWAESKHPLSEMTFPMLFAAWGLT